MKERRDGEAEIIPMPRQFDAGGIAPIVGEMVFLPLTMMLYGLKLLARTARATPGATDEPRATPGASGRQIDVARDSPPVAAAPGWSSLPRNWTHPPLEMVRTPSAPEIAQYEPVAPMHTQGPRNVGSHEPQGGEEQRRMEDNKSLQDDMLKTVRYWVSFEKRGYETVLYQQIDQVYDNLTDAQFTAWKMAEFMDELETGGVKLPARAAGDKRSVFPEHKDHKGKLGEISADDKRYLALDWEVVGRVQRRRGWFEERKTDALEDIAENLAKQPRVLRVEVNKK